MTEAQARSLGELIRSARMVQGISSHKLAKKVGVAKGWLAGVEAGRFLDPAPARVARLAEALDIPAGRVDSITRNAVSDGLPELRAYFRAKYALTPEQIDQVQLYVERLRRAA